MFENRHILHYNGSDWKHCVQKREEREMDVLSRPDNEFHLTYMPGNLTVYEAFYDLSERISGQGYHCHDFYEIYFHIRGGHFFGLDNDMYRLEPDQMIVVPPFCMHGLVAEGEMCNYERAYLNLPVESLKKFGCGQVDLERIFRSCTSNGRNRFQLEREDAERCVRLIRELQAHQEDKNELLRLTNCSRVLEFLSIVCGVIGRTEAIITQNVSNSIIQEVITYINSHYTEQIRIDDIARRFGVSGSYLSHEFTRYTSRSMYDYVLYRRVMLAREMISGDLSLNQIAYQCGFNDYSNFLRMFTRIVGTSPARYRRQMREINEKSKK